MRRILVALLAGFALAAAIGAIGVNAGAVVVTQNGKVLTTQSPVYTDSKVLQPLPSGARAAPDTQLPHSNTKAFVLLAIVALALIAALVLWLATRILALEPAWVTDGRRSFAEAGWRMSTAWAEFKDWVRIGH